MWPDLERLSHIRARNRQIRCVQQGELQLIIFILLNEAVEESRYATRLITWPAATGLLNTNVSNPHSS